MPPGTFGADEHEQGFVHALDRHHRPRFEQLLPNPRKRRQVLDRLCHSNPFREEHLIRDDRQPAEVLSALKARGAPDTCYVLSEDSGYDQRFLPLAEVLPEVFANGVAFVLSCIPGRLLFFQGEEVGARWIVDTRAERPDVSGR